MITVKVERSGFNLNIFAENFGKRLIQPLINQLANEVEKTMREKTPTRTGALRASITKEVRDREAVIGPTVHYALFVEAGIRPHEIRPVHAKALRFEMSGRIIFAARVYHPGARPQPFIRETIDQIALELPAVYEQVFKEAIKE